MKNLFLLTFILLLFYRCVSQSENISNIIIGNIKGIGWNIGDNSDGATNTLNIDCSECESIGKAYLIAIEIDAINDGETTAMPLTNIIINNQDVWFSNDTRYGNFKYVNPQDNISFIHLAKVNLDLPMNSITFTIPPREYLHVFSGFYILFECLTSLNSTLTSYNLNLNISPSPDLEISSGFPLVINPIDTNFDVGLSIVGLTMTSLVGDASIVTFNNILLGEISGQDLSSVDYMGSGVRGHFSYEDGLLIGLDDDTADGIMDGTDGLANVQSLIDNSSSCFFSCKHEIIGNRTNYVEAAILTYSTTCDTFTVTTIPDTTICPNTPLQLFATGGTSTGLAPAYEWLPATDLSCSTCPNPIFTGDSSQFYTVRIWNNDSCSVVRPVKVIVRPEPQFGAITTIPTICGTNSGQVILSAQVGTATPISYSWNGGTNQPSGTFSNLFAGNQLFTLQDGFGCTNDTLITVLENNPTIAQFSLDPTIGTVPLAVSVSNTSQFATEYSWWLNGVDQGNTFSSFVCDTSGTYSIELIAWQYDPSCADTFSLSVIALDRLIVPTAFTPDNDGVNDTWELPNIDAIYPKNTVQIFNRWGTLLYETKEGKYASNSWDGTFEGMALPVGSYYFIIDLNVEGVENLNGVVSVVLDTF